MERADTRQVELCLHTVPTGGRVGGKLNVLSDNGDVKPFLRCNEDIASATKAKLLGFLLTMRKSLSSRWS